MRQFLVVLAIIAFVVIGGLIIFAIPWGGSSDKQEERQQTALTDFASTGASAQLHIRGRVTNDKEHQELTISVNRDEVVATLFQGYDFKEVRSTRTTNTQKSYEVFLSALLNAGFTSRQRERKALSIPGVCPGGELYQYSLVNVTTDGAPKPAWATSCSTKDGNFGGSIGKVNNLFEDQVYNYDDFTRGTEF